MAFPSAAVHLFPLISVFGLYAVSSFFANSGLAVAFAESQAQNGPARLLPDGQTPVLTSYTGLGPLDAYLSNLQYIFVPVVDGSSLKLSLLGWHWGNLLLALFTVMLGESLRTGRRRDLVFFALWGLAIQYCGYFVTMPVYCYVHLLSSSTHTQTTTMSRISSKAVGAIPISVLVGYVLPSVAMSLSSLHSGQSRQVAVAVWQNFPLWVAVVQWALTSGPSPDPAPSKATSSTGKALFGKSVARVYRDVALVSGLLHVAGLVPVVLATLCPEQLVKLSPVTLDEATLQSLQAGNFFLPPKWDNPVQISSMAEGAGNFLRYDYYIGTAAALLWATMLQASRGEGAITGRSGWLASTGVTQALMIITTTVALGPGSTIAILMS